MNQSLPKLELGKELHGLAHLGNNNTTETVTNENKRSFSCNVSISNDFNLICTKWDGVRPHRTTSPCLIPPSMACEIPGGINCQSCELRVIAIPHRPAIREV